MQTFSQKRIAGPACTVIGKDHGRKIQQIQQAYSYPALSPPGTKTGCIQRLPDRGNHLPGSVPLTSAPFARGDTIK